MQSLELDVAPPSIALNPVRVQGLQWFHVFQQRSEALQTFSEVHNSFASLILNLWRVLAQGLSM